MHALSAAESGEASAERVQVEQPKKKEVLRLVYFKHRLFYEWLLGS
jgi:hypothetical protein